MSKYIVQHNIKIKQLLNKQLLNTIFVENISCALDTKFKRLFFLLLYGSKFDPNKILRHYTCYICKHCHTERGMGGNVRHNWKPFCAACFLFSQQVKITVSKCSRVWQQVFWTMDTPFLMSHITFNVILTITNAISKNLPSSGTKWLPIMTYIHPLS